jgi:hypothetical protein
MFSVGQLGGLIAIDYNSFERFSRRLVPAANFIASHLSYEN